jgi:hypothetical protein
MRDLPARVLVVWEPVLITDRAGPRPASRARVTDRRAMQYWDEHHYLSEQYGGPKSVAGFEGAKILFEMKKVVWDYVAVYPPGGKWRDVARKPAFSGGAVVKVKADLRDALRR